MKRKKNKSLSSLFDKRDVVTDKIFGYVESDIQELLEKDNSVLAERSYFNVDMGKLIENVSKKYDINPVFLAIVLMAKADHLKYIDRDPSVEDVSKSLDMHAITNPAMLMESFARLIIKTKKNIYASNNLKVSVSDCKNKFQVKNKPTAVLYKILPWIGNKNHKVYKRKVDEEGNIIKVWKVTEKTEPFGVKLFWMMAHGLGYKDIVK